MHFRPAEAADAEAIAALHADSWQRHYRGAFADAYLDGPVLDDRRAVWRERLATAWGTSTTLAESGGTLAGFAHVILDADPTYGALVDNLHVRHDLQRAGVGRQLMARAAAFVVVERPTAAMYLWVLEQNVRAQAFYRALGGEEADREETPAPGGGSVVGIRMVWRDPTTLT